MTKKDFNLLIIQPTHYRSKTDRRLFKTRRRAVVPLTLPYLAALTPPEWSVALVDEQLDEIDYDRPVDLVALTTWTLHSLRAYDIAAEFRRRGVPVIMGGPHVFFYPEEALEHCDAIGIGEAEPIWPKMLADAAAGRLQRIYRAEPQAELAHLPPPRYDLLDLRRFGPFRTYTVQSSPGCRSPARGPIWRRGSSISASGGWPFRRRETTTSTPIEADGLPPSAGIGDRKRVDIGEPSGRESTNATEEGVVR